MIVQSFEERTRSVMAFNERQMKIKRDRSYVPLVIEETIDTTTFEWLLHCLALHYVNQPTAKERKSGLEILKQKNPVLYEKIVPLIGRIETEHFGYSQSVV
ncbi:hypothetical protein [Thiomicrorhabdus cannonii]|uniref:hypothetical protein n=1 Tax=Thiomicrorhabdus cannonii TaxID=2748011 RepID=UPI0015BCD2C2|nr:hypothetical protein [Thiomicrorhabdus cannonii]